MSGTPHPPGTARWATALGLILLVGVMPQFLLGALGPQLRDALGISAADVGLAFSVLAGSAVLVAPLLGRAVDRTGGRIGGMAVLAVSGCSLLAASFATSRTMLLVALVPAGLAMAAANPATNRWASDARDARLQSLLVGVAQASVQAGALGAGLLAAAVAVGVDWRGAMRIAAGLAALGILAALRSPSDAPGPLGRGTGAGVGAVGVPPVPGRSAAARARRHVRVGLAGYAMLMGGGTALVLTFLPTYAVDRVGLGVAAAGATATVYGAVAVATRLALSATLRDPDRVIARVLVLLALGSALGMSLIASADTAGPGPLWAGTVVFGASGTAWPMVAYLGAVRFSGPGEAGAVAGWVTAAFYLGLWATPLLGGAVVVAAGYATLWTIAIVCALAALVPAVALAAPARHLSRARPAETSP